MESGLAIENEFAGGNGWANVEYEYELSDGNELGRGAARCLSATP
jgi:hypothetical protein